MDRVSIENDDPLYRRIHPSHIKPDRTISSAAFKGSDSYKLSVDLARLTTPQEVLERAIRLNKECIGVGQIIVVDARNLEQDVCYDPLDDNDPGGPNPAHSLVIGDKPDPIAKKLARKSQIIHWA